MTIDPQSPTFARNAGDYAVLAEHGVRTVRDAFRWHLIEREAGRRRGVLLRPPRRRSPTSAGGPRQYNDAMPCSEWSLQTVADRFALTVEQKTGRFANIAPTAAISPILQTLLAEQVPLAVAINTRKKRGPK